MRCIPPWALPARGGDCPSPGATSCRILHFKPVSVLLCARSWPGYRSSSQPAAPALVDFEAWGDVPSWPDRAHAASLCVIHAHSPDLCPYALLKATRHLSPRYGLGVRCPCYGLGMGSRAPMGLPRAVYAPFRPSACPYRGILIPYVGATQSQRSRRRGPLRGVTGLTWSGAEPFGRTHDTRVANQVFDLVRQPANLRAGRDTNRFSGMMPVSALIAA